MRKAWEDMTRIEQMRAEFSDLHKDVFGIRPHHIDISAMTDEEFEIEYNELLDLLESDNV